MNSNDISNLFNSIGQTKECNEKLADNLLEKLSNEQKQKLNDTLNNPQLLQSLLNSPEAQKIIAKISAKEKRE